MTTDHHAAAEWMLANADEWAAQAGELSPKASECACLDRATVHALLAVHDALTAADRYAANEAKQREAEPDPLDEDDHRDRLDCDGDIWQRVHEGCWMEPGFPPVSHGPAECLPLTALPGPLAFAPDAAQEAAGGDLSAPESESRAEEGCDTDDAQKAILCPECGDHINTHNVEGCRFILCDCPRTPEDVARALIAEAVKTERATRLEAK